MFGQHHKNIICMKMKCIVRRWTPSIPNHLQIKQRRGFKDKPASTAPLKTQFSKSHNKTGLMRSFVSRPKQLYWFTAVCKQWPWEMIRQDNVKTALTVSKLSQSARRDPNHLSFFDIAHFLMTSFETTSPLSPLLTGSRSVKHTYT